MGYNTTQHPPIPRPTAQPHTSQGEACFNKRAMSMGLFHSSFSGLCYTTQLYKCVSVISGFPAFWIIALSKSENLENLLNIKCLAE
jgi:hypothetical protein